MSLYCKSRAATEISTLWEAARKITVWGEAVEKCICRSCPSGQPLFLPGRYMGPKWPVFPEKPEGKCSTFQISASNEKH